MSALRVFHTSTLCETHLGRTVEIKHSPPVIAEALPTKILLTAAMHGDEPEGVYLMEQFLNTRACDRLPAGVDLYVVPCLNPDGYAAHARFNGRRVDINRNFPTSDWSAEARAERYFPGVQPGSEPETQAIMQWAERERPHLVINFHSWNPMVNFNGDCEDLAQVMSAVNGCPVTSDMGYPTPGSTGTWLWEAVRVPSITLEIQEGWTRAQVEASSHLEALVCVISAARAKHVSS